MDAQGKKARYRVKINRDKCKGCQLCILNCPTHHLGLSSELNRRSVTFARITAGTHCIGCGFCFHICPDSCVEIYETRAGQA